MASQSGGDLQRATNKRNKSPVESFKNQFSTNHHSALFTHLGDQSSPDLESSQNPAESWSLNSEQSSLLDFEKYYHQDSVTGGKPKNRANSGLVSVNLKRKRSNSNTQNSNPEARLLDQPSSKRPQWSISQNGMQPNGRPDPNEISKSLADSGHSPSAHTAATSSTSHAASGSTPSFYPRPTSHSTFHTSKSFDTSASRTSRSSPSLETLTEPPSYSSIRNSSPTLLEHANMSNTLNSLELNSLSVGSSAGRSVHSPRISFPNDPISNRLAQLDKQQNDQEVADDSPRHRLAEVGVNEPENVPDNRPGRSELENREISELNGQLVGLSDAFSASGGLAAGSGLPMSNRSFNTKQFAILMPIARSSIADYRTNQTLNLTHQLNLLTPSTQLHNDDRQVDFQLNEELFDNSTYYPYDNDEPVYYPNPEEMLGELQGIERNSP